MSRRPDLPSMGEQRVPVSGAAALVPAASQTTFTRRARAGEYRSMPAVGRGAVQMLVGPQGFTLSVGGTLAVLIGRRGYPGVVGIWPFVIAAGVGFAVAARATAADSHDEGGGRIVGPSVYNFTPVVIVPVVPTVAAWLPNDDLAFALAGALVTSSYVACFGVWMWLCRGYTGRPSAHLRTGTRGTLGRCVAMADRGSLDRSEGSRGAHPAPQPLPDDYDSLWSGDMKAAILQAADQIMLRDWPAPGDSGDALVHVVRAGVCGTDRKIVGGLVPARFPLVLGHEIVGRIERPASDSQLRSGTLVVVDPATYCGLCAACRRDLTHLCRHGGLIGRDEDGGFAEYVSVPASRLHALPDSMDPDDAVMVQVLSTCVHAQSLVRHEIGQSALVVGLGVAGQLHVQLLAASGARPIIGVGRSAAKRALAVEMGATVAVTPEEALPAVRELTDDDGVDIAVDGVGSRETLLQAMTAARPGATVLLYGLVPPPADGMPTYDWYYKELKLINTRAARPRDFTAAISAITNGLVSGRKLVTSSFPLDDISAALAASAAPGALKVALTVSA